MPLESTLILNSSSSLIRKIGDKPESDESAIAAKQIYRLALLSHRQLTADELESFLYDSFDMLEKNF
jgi:molecular chaperone HtpG